MQGLIGKKIGMTRIFEESGRVIPVTVVQTGNNVVHQIKTVENDGYGSIQVGFGEIAERKLTKPLLGHFKKQGSTPTRFIKEFKLDSDGETIEVGTVLGLEVLDGVEFVNVTGTSKGRGHTGTIKRYNFQRGRETHGNTNHRERGSIGQNSYPARVFPGLKMSGHSGNHKVTTKRLKLVSVDKELGLVFIQGAIPGPNKGIVFIKKN